MLTADTYITLSHVKHVTSHSTVPENRPEVSLANTQGNFLSLLGLRPEVSLKGSLAIQLLLYPLSFTFTEKGL